MRHGLPVKMEDITLDELQALHRSGYTMLWIEKGKLYATPGEADGLFSPNILDLIRKYSKMPITLDPAEDLLDITKA